MRLIIMIVVLLLVFGGGGAVAYFYFGIGKSVEATADGEAVVAEESHSKEEKGHGGGHGKGSEYVEISPLVFPLIDSSGVHQVVSLVVSVEVPDHKGVAKIEELGPRLNDAYIQELYGYLNRAGSLKNGAIQISELKKRLNRVTARVIGEDYFSDVLLQVVQQHSV